VRKSTHAFDANAQAFFNKIFDAIEGGNLSSEDMDLGSEETLPRVAVQYGGGPGDWAWELSGALRQASTA
jgi:hypothetical protein